jgi:hypothetical protein
MDKKKQIVDLSPQNTEYSQKIAQARAVQHPVGGAPMPKMPNFADAQQQGDRYAGVQGHQQARRAQGMATLLTPEQQRQLDEQGAAIPGVGAAYVANQPNARRVLDPRNQAPQFQNPPRPEGAGITEQTAAQLDAVAKANAPDAPVQDTEKLKKEIDDIEDELFDFDEMGNRIKNQLANKERRDLIESRCEPMDLMSLLVDREVRQVVPIIPGKYYPTFRSCGGDEDLEIKRMIAKEQSSTTYVLAKMTIMQLTCGLFALNNKPLPSHLDKDGNFDEVAFKEKLKNLLKYPVQVLADLAVNYTWFDRRVRALISFEAIKDF